MNTNIYICHETKVQDQADFSTVLDFATLPVIFLTPNFEVSYFNFKAFDFFQAHESAFKKCDFSFQTNLLNTHFSIFEERLRSRLTEIETLGLGQMLTELIRVDYLHLELRITPLFTLTHQKFGLCVEIHDKTELLNTLDLLNTTIENAKDGLFDTIIPMGSVSKEYEILPVLSEKINSLFETTHEFFGEIACAFEDLINGNLTHSLTFTQAEEAHPDSFFSATKRDFNYVLKNLSEFINKIKNASQLMLFVLNQILMKNSELAMASEKETAETVKIEQNLDVLFGQASSTYLEISQAIEVAKTLTNHYAVIDELKTVFHDVRLQLRAILDATRYMHYIFKGHLGSLRAALVEIEVGNIGRGIHLVTTECEEMIVNTTNLMQKIQLSVAAMTARFDDKHQSLDTILETLSHNINGMIDIVTLMTTVLSEVRDTLSDHSALFVEFKQSLGILQESHQFTLETVEQTILLNATLMYVNNDLETVLSNFEQQRESSDEHAIADKNEQLLLQQKQILDQIAPIYSVN